jgi:tryptophan 2,3-dioxygenase
MSQRDFARVGLRGMNKPMKNDASGRRIDGNPLSYTDYINVEAIVGSLRIPKEVPQGAVAERWPQWPEGWEPGDAWPRSEGWYHDEALFITVHQAFEVWFRHMLHELGDVLAGAQEIAKAHSVSIPLVNLAARRDAPELAAHRGRYPQIWALAEQTPETHPLRHVPAPGVHRVEGAQASLKWFDDKWDTWANRVTRSSMILRAALPSYDILSMMSPSSFLDFRDRLFPASGFGSYQFRYLEIALGLRERHLEKIDWSNKDTKKIRATLTAAGFDFEEISQSPRRPEESFNSTYAAREMKQLYQRLAAPSLRDLVYWLLNATELQGTNGKKTLAHADALGAKIFASMSRVEQAESMVHRPHLSDATLRNGVWRGMGDLMSHSEVVSAARLHRDTDSQLHKFLEACLGLDTALLDWRNAHIRFVERMIGARPGTGGGGLGYLNRTVGGGRAFHLDRAFPCLWQSRTVLM